MTNWRDEEASKGERFEYNLRGQLIKATYRAEQAWTSNPQNPLGGVENFSVNSLNRQSVTRNGITTGDTPNALNQYKTVGGQTLDYDWNFNLKSFDGATFAYNAQNQLVSASKGGNTIQFLYDGLGRCVRRTVNGVATSIAYDGWKPVVERDLSGNTKAVNIYGAGPDEILWRSVTGLGDFRYHHDARGNVMFVLDGGGYLVEKYSYDAFGRPRIMDWNGNERTQTAIGNRFLFQGREWIPELGIYDYRRRAYHPGLGRLLQADPLGLQTEGEKLSAGQKALFSPGGVAPEAFSASEMNLYRYCHNDPVDGTDPLGLDYLEVDYTSTSTPVSAPGQRDVSGNVYSGILTWRTDAGVAVRSYNINSGGYKSADSKVEGAETPTFAGRYAVDNLRDDRGGLMRYDGKGFSLDVNPRFKQEKGKEQTLIRIHPDGGEKGTHGCIGIREPGGILRDFAARMKEYLKKHKDIELRVNSKN